MHKPTDEQRKLVRSMSGFGIPQLDICAVIGISRPTLEKHYREELDKAAAEANAKVAQSLFQNCLNGNVTAQIWWTKARMRWKETVLNENQTLDANGNPAAPAVPAVVVNISKT